MVVLLINNATGNANKMVVISLGLDVFSMQQIHVDRIDERKEGQWC